MNTYQKGKITLIMTTKAIRNISNGLFFANFIPYLKYCNTRATPSDISMTILACFIMSILKSKLIIKFKNNTKMTLAFIYTLFIGTFVINLFNLFFWDYRYKFLILVALGIYPSDGQDFHFFQELQIQLMNRNSQYRKQKRLIIYKWIGFIFQAIGCLIGYLYMVHNLPAINYNICIRNRSMLIILYYLSILNVSLFTAISFLNKKQDNQIIIRSNDDIVIHPLSNKLKIANFINGLALGTLCSPFLAYFLDIKYNMHPETIGFVMFMLFLMKGIGQQAMNQFISLKRLFDRWNILSILCLFFITFMDSVNIVIYCILFAFPMWYFSRASLKQKIYQAYGITNQGNIKSNKTETADNMIKDGSSWQNIGSTIGIFISSYSFNILYTKWYFMYPFFITAIFKIISQLFLLYFGPINVPQIKQTNEFNQIQPQSDILNTTQQNIIIEKQQKCSIKFYYALLRSLPILLISCLTTLFIYNKLNIDTLLPQNRLSTKSDQFIMPPQLKLFNSSLAHIWFKQNLTNIKLIDCDQLCKDQIKNRDQYYNKMYYDSNQAQWIHFPNMPYIKSRQQLQETIKVIQKYRMIKGFSFAWNDPFRYNKLPYQIYPLLNQAGMKYGFYYDQMPSLNIRGPQYKIIKIYTKNQRKQTILPSFIDRQPPKNYLAFQTTTKLSTNHQYLRQFILYHLKIGYDKFFIYNNQLQPTDPLFYKQFRQLGSYYKQCFTLGYSEQYQNINQIWQDFYDHIILIPWRIKFDYPQGQAFLNYGLFYAHDTIYTSYNDIDQFIFSKQYIPDILKKLSQQNIGGIHYASRNFISRACLKKQLAIQQTLYLEQKSNHFTLKQTVLTKMSFDTSVHYKVPFNGIFLQIDDPKHDLRLIHYKITQTYRQFQKKPVYKTDQSLIPFVLGIKKACQGKCSDSRNITCSKQVYQQKMKLFCLIQPKLL